MPNEDTSEDFALAMQLQYEEERLYQISHAKDHGSTKLIFDRPNTYGVVFPLDASPSVKVDQEVRKHYVGVNSHYSGNMSDGTVVHPTQSTKHDKHFIGKVNISWCACGVP